MMWGWFRRESATTAEQIERRLMAEWIKPEPAAQAEALSGDPDAKALAQEYGLYIAFNWHATEPRWEVTCRGEHRCFANEYSQSLGDAIRECVRKAGLR